MHYEPWTNEQEKRVERLYQSGMTPTQIAPLMGRSVHAINRRIELMLIPRKRKYRAWTMPEVNRAAKMREAGATFKAIGDELGRTDWSVRLALKRNS